MATILVVDDEAVDREDVARSLEGVEALELVEVKSAEAALEHVASTLPDLVLTDLRMPGMNGLELVKRLQEEHPQLPVILMTSQGSERIAVEALQAGASSYVPKSSLADELPDTISKVLQIVESRQLHSALVAHLESAEVRFELGNDYKLAFPLASYFEDDLARLGFGNPTTRAQVGLAIVEAVTNAIVHGNLEVASGVRQESHRKYFDIIRKRAVQQPYASRKVRFTARESPDAVEYTVADEGPGFDASALPDPRAPENLLKVSGRGVMLIRTFMDEVRFNDRGNEVTMVRRLAQDGAAPDA